jgi:2-succinyl-6-hydroxy-2,4-cyclohexadiene-1-carboxylate synthase
MALTYKTLGPSTQPPLLMLHGFLGCSQDLSAIAPATNHHCLLPDLPGHGGSLAPGDWAMGGVAAAVVSLLDGLGVDQTAIYGYSMGGRLALYLAVHWPDRFPKVILESASPGLETEVERQVRIGRDRQWIDLIEQDFPTFLTQWYAQPLFANLLKQPEFRQIYKRRLGNDPKGVARSLAQMGLGQQPSLWEALPKLRSQVFLLVGEQDEKFVAINRRMEGLIPGAKLTIAPAGHTVHMENPGAAIAVLRSGLRSNGV